MQSRAMAEYVAEAENVEKRFNGSIFIREAGFVVKNLVSDEEKIQAHRLRHRVYCEELEWVPRSETLMEIDEYDSHAAFIGVFNEDHALVAFMRLTLPGAPFMIEKEFSSLIGPWHQIRKQSDTTEASRSCVAPEARGLFVRGSFGVHRLSMPSLQRRLSLVLHEQHQICVYSHRRQAAQGASSQRIPESSGRRTDDYARRVHDNGGGYRLEGIRLRQYGKTSGVRQMVHSKRIKPLCRATATA